MKRKKFQSGFLRGDGSWIGFFRLILLILFPLGFLITNIITRIFYQDPFILGGFLLIYFFILISATATAVYYLGDIYQMEFDRIPFRYFMACFFGLITPNVHIHHEQIGSEEQDMVEQIGGPANLKIDPGFVILTETLTEPGNIYGQGSHFISRYERIYEIVDLREQEGISDKITALTKDGIQVIVENTKFNYRIWDARWETMYQDKYITRNPYPYSTKAIHDFAYKRPVQLNSLGKPELASWENAVKGPVTGIIKNYISEHKLDDVIAPRDQDKHMVREEIRGIAYENGFKETLRGIGTLLRWWDPGEFSSQKEVEDQFISNWSVDIIRDIEINKAHGEAQKKAYEEKERTEAEAELLTSIIQALDGIQLGKDKAQSLQNLILLRTAQVIKAFNDHPADEPQKSYKNPSSHK